MAIFKKAMDYLGLGPDDAYDDYEPAPEPDRPIRAQRQQRETEPRTARGQSYETDYDSPVRAVPARPSFPSRDGDTVSRRPTPAPDESTVQPRPTNPSRQSSGARVVPLAVAGEPHTVRPLRFDSAQEVADKFKAGVPVIMNLEAADREASRRLIDFASGLCYGLNGAMEKVASGVYLLKPPAPRQSGYDGDDFG